VRILITGAAGFVGATLVRTWAERGHQHQIFGLDNFSRPGSESNRAALRRLGVNVVHADIRNASDFETLPDVDWVIDAAANPSVLAGTDGRTSARQLIEHNLIGSANILEFCRARRAGFILLSTSRVYSLAALSTLPVKVKDGAFAVDADPGRGISERGLTETFSTAAPRSIYGTSKVASEDLALEYANAFDVPVWINRCGVLAGAGQFARPDQGIFAYWIHSWATRRPLAYIGFDGAGHQVRDCLHPRDLVPLLDAQMTAAPGGDRERIQNVSGGAPSACSLRQVSDWCNARLGAHSVTASPEPRKFDVPWLILDSARAEKQWGWKPVTTRDDIFTEIAAFAGQHPEWLELSMP
jgi:CDP-paratose 2-epimerase